MPETLVVHFYGGPGSGKSTTSALVFGALKQKGYSVEMAHEYAKDLTWESRTAALGFQPYVIAKQMWRTRRLEHQVDVILTDTSILLGLIYGTPRDLTPEFKAWIASEYRRMNTLDFVLERNPSDPYHPEGRSQTEAEAIAIDYRTTTLLQDAGVSYVSLSLDKEAGTHVDIATNLIEERLCLQQ